jgi:hypothetical protein
VHAPKLLARQALVFVGFIREHGCEKQHGNENRNSESAHEASGKAG